jgi:hypothetical protein
MAGAAEGRLSMRIAQGVGNRGSLRWIQRAVARKSASFEHAILQRTGATAIEWRSPLEADGFAEYRDGAFLGLLGLDAHVAALADFWPARGPQWDALGVTDKGDILIVEAKAHIGEVCSPGSQAGEKSRAIIQARLEALASTLGARSDHAPWTDHFYQLANRLAHLHFLRERGVRAWLVLANFLGDGDMKGPLSRVEWEAAYRVVWHVMGLDARHPLAKAIIEIFPDVTELA